MLLHELLSGKQNRIPPAINQCAVHPYWAQRQLLVYRHARGVHLQAYSALGSSGFKASHEPVVLDDPVLQELAKKYQRTTAQIALAWAIQRGTSVVVKSATLEHQQENIDTLGTVELSADDIQRIDSLDRNYRLFRPEDWWGNMPVAVFH